MVNDFRKLLHSTCQLYRLTANCTSLYYKWHRETNVVPPNMYNFELLFGKVLEMCYIGAAYMK